MSSFNKKIFPKKPKFRKKISHNENQKPKIYKYTYNTYYYIYYNSGNLVIPHTNLNTR